MATWFLIIFLFISLTFLLRHLLRLKTSPLPLPPSPNFFPFLGPLRWLRRGYNDINSYLRSVQHRLGPIISLRVIFLPAIFVSDRFLAHKTLVLNDTFFSDREEVVSKTRSFEKMKSEAEKCLTQGERLCTDKTEFENETYFLSVLNAKKAKLRALRDKEDSGRAVEEEEEATDKAESFDRGRSDNEQSEEEASKKATTSSKARLRKRATRS